MGVAHSFAIDVLSVTIIRLMAASMNVVAIGNSASTNDKANAVIDVGSGSSASRMDGSAMVPDLSWTDRSYPDIRGEDWPACGDHLPTAVKYYPYICDPDHLLNQSEVEVLNKHLHRLAVGTECHCQRRSQCTMADKHGEKFDIGNVVAVALMNHLRFIQQPTPEYLDESATAFIKGIQGKWALGDCGNSVIIFIWKEQKKVYITTNRTTRKYLTSAETGEILQQIKDDIDKGFYSRALLHMIDKMHMELNGHEKKKADIGTLSLIVSVLCAVVIVAIITGCVCGFRCFGNLRGEIGETNDRLIDKMDSFKTSKSESLKRGDKLRTSGATKLPNISPSPIRPPLLSTSKRLPQPPPAGINAYISGYVRGQEDTTIV